MKIGIFGGSFNPPHMGHINLLTTVQKKAGLNKIYVVPAHHSPLKSQLDNPNSEHRCEMVKLALESYGKSFEVDEQEIQRGGISYTIDTISNYRKKFEPKELFLIIGADKFEELEKWKDWETLICECNLIVTSRPGYDLPTVKEELPKFLKTKVADFDFNFVELDTGRSIQFITLEDLDISSLVVRKNLRAGRPVIKLLPLAVESFIRKNRLYAPLSEKIGDYLQLVDFCGKFLMSKKGIAIKAFDLRGFNSISDFVIVSSGTSTKHASSLADNLVRAVKEEYQIHPIGVEGGDEGRWVVIDYGSLIVHIFYDYVRSEYNLEGLWKNAKQIEIKE